MKFIVKPKKRVYMALSCSGDCSNNCFGKCNRLGNCFCPLDR